MEPVTLNNSTDTRVSSVWRSIAIGLMIGIAAFAIDKHYRPKPPEPKWAIRELQPTTPTPQSAPNPLLEEELGAVDFDQADLHQVLDWFRQHTELNIVSMLEEAHRSFDIRPVTLHLKHVKLRRALDAAMQKASTSDTSHVPGDALRWYDDDGIVKISTEQQWAESHVVTVLYDVRPIMDHIAKTDDRMGRLEKIIVDCIQPTTWKDNGGDIGSISDCAGQLIITQQPIAQSQIAALLKRLASTSDPSGGIR